MTKVNNTFFMLDYHPFFFFLALTVAVMFGRKHVMPSRCLNCIYRAARTNDSNLYGKRPSCCSRTTVLLKILVSGPYTGNLLYFHIRREGMFDRASAQPHRFRRHPILHPIQRVFLQMASQATSRSLSKA